MMYDQKNIKLLSKRNWPPSESFRAYPRAQKDTGSLLFQFIGSVSKSHWTSKDEIADSIRRGNNAQYFGLFTTC